MIDSTTELSEVYQRFNESAFEIRLPKFVPTLPEVNKSLVTIQPKLLNQHRVNELRMRSGDQVITKFSREFTERNDEFLMGDEVPGVRHAFDHLDIIPVPHIGALDSKDWQFIYVKINHGFWEHFLTTFSSLYSPSLHRVVSGANFRNKFLEPGLIAPLSYLIRTIQQPASEFSKFTKWSELHYGVSLGNGALPHSELVIDPIDSSIIIKGASLGLLNFHRTITGQQSFQFFDGAFPKASLLSGQLAGIVEQSVDVSDEVVFVVPTHLREICLKSSTIKQTVVLISRTQVHQLWMDSLFQASLIIYDKLKKGTNVTVFVQGGVFAALLGFFLGWLINQNDFPGKLRFFDLGQVLDVGFTGGGPWVPKQEFQGVELPFQTRTISSGKRLKQRLPGKVKKVLTTKWRRK